MTVANKAGPVPASKKWHSPRDGPEGRSPPDRKQTLAILGIFYKFSFSYSDNE